jgi:hypothetical protein
MHPSTDPKLVAEALDWLSFHWAGPALLPLAVAQIEAENKLRQAA